MKIIRYVKSNVQSITEAGIEYSEDDGRRLFIDFEECRRGWINFVNSSDSDNHFPGRIISVDDSKCVAWRDGVARPPYFEFFADPRIRFEFYYLYSNMYARQWFRDLQLDIQKVGWRTFDLG